AIASGPGHGTLTSFNAATGAFTYKPNTNFHGTDSFTFTASDGINTSTAATVIITVVANQSNIGLYDPRKGTWLLPHSNAHSSGPDIVVQYGSPGMIPVAGDWFGTGITTIGLYNPQTGTWLLRADNNPAPEAPAVIVQYGSPGMNPVVGDWFGTGTTTIGLF